MQQKTTKKLSLKNLRYLAAAFTLLMILIVVLADLDALPGLFSIIYIVPHGDSIVHFILMGILSFILHLAFATKRVTPLRLSRTALIMLAIVTLEECSQLFFANRSFSLLDLSADIAGILLMAELGIRVRKGVAVQ